MEAVTKLLLSCFYLGLEETESGVWKLFAAIIVHAIAIVFCIGNKMLIATQATVVCMREVPDHGMFEGGGGGSFQDA